MKACNTTKRLCHKSNVYNILSHNISQNSTLNIITKVLFLMLLPPFLWHSTFCMEKNITSRSYSSFSFNSSLVNGSKPPESTLQGLGWEEEKVIITKSSNNDINIYFDYDAYGDFIVNTFSPLQNGMLAGRSIIDENFQDRVYFVESRYSDFMYKRLIQYTKEQKYKVFHKINREYRENNTYLFAIVKIYWDVSYIIYCTDANSRGYGSLFSGSEAIKIEILSCGSNIKNMKRMFLNCCNLTELDLKKLNTRQVTNMSYMFAHGTSLESLDLSNFDTAQVTDMKEMFNNCANVKSLNLSSFNTSNVTDMHGMFKNCYFLQNLDLSSFNTSNVTDMHGMFKHCYSLQNLDLTNFNTSKVTLMTDMFWKCESVQMVDVSGFNTDLVTSMWDMFYKCTSLTNLDLSNFNTHNVRNMSFMFADCSSLIDLNLSNFDTSNVTNMGCMFYNCSSIKKLNLSNLTIKQGTNIDNMFKNCFECNATLICKYSTVLHMLDEHAKYVFTCANKGPSE